MLYQAGQSAEIQSSKLIMDDVFKNSYQKHKADDQKYFYFKAISKLKVKYQSNQRLAQDLFYAHKKPVTRPKSKPVAVYTVQKLNPNLFKLGLKEESITNNQPTLPISRRFFVLSSSHSDRTGITGKSLPSMPPTLDDSTRPKLAQLVKKHKESQKAYRSRQMEKYCKTQAFEEWKQLSEKLSALRKKQKLRSHTTYI